MGVLSTLTGVVMAVTAYTASTVFQTYWLAAPLSLYGQFIFFIGGIALISGCMLIAVAVYFRDPRILLTHHNRSGRRLFCCTLCHSASAADRPSDAPYHGDSINEDVERLPSQGWACCPLRWARLSQTEVMCLMGINNGTAGMMQFYATPPQRQPPLISALLSSLTVIAAIPLSKYSLGDKKRFASLQVIASCNPKTLYSASPFLVARSCSRPYSTQYSCVLTSIAHIGKQRRWHRIRSQHPCVDRPERGISAALGDGKRRCAGVLDASRRAPRRIRRPKGFYCRHLSIRVLQSSVCWSSYSSLLLGRRAAVVRQQRNDGRGSWFDGRRFERLCAYDAPSLPNIISLQFVTGLAFSIRCSLLGAAAAGRPPAGSTPGSTCTPNTPLYAALSILPYGLYLAGTALVSQDSGVFGNVVQVCRAT